MNRRQNIIVSSLSLRNRNRFLKKLHPSGLFEKDLKRSTHGVLKAIDQSTNAQIPSLYYYLSQTCGVSFVEADYLLSQGRIWLGGRPLQNGDALRAQLPRDFIPKLGVEVVNASGLRVNASDRAAHRYYGFMWVTDSQSYAADETDPRSYVHHIAKHSGEVKLSLPDGGSLLFRVSGDGLDKGSSANLIRGSGCRRGVSGLAVLTNDVSIIPFFNFACGFDAGYRVGFARGTPDAAVEHLVQQIPNEISNKRVVVLADAESQIRRSVKLHPPSASTDHCWLLDLETPHVPRRLFHMIGKLQPDTFAVTRIGTFKYDEVAQPPAGTACRFRKMNEAERYRLFEEVKRLQINRLVGSLRDTAEV